MQNYTEALKWAKACLEEQGSLTDLNDYQGTTFLTQTNPEVVFTMGGNFVGAGLSVGSGAFTVSNDLMQWYTEDDLRKQVFFDSPKEGVYPYKKASKKSGSRDISDNFVLRTAEAYLNLAEAAACLGNEYTTEALNAYNTIRERRLANYTEDRSLTGKDLVEAIRLERRTRIVL